MGGKIGVMVEINCETDFVAMTDDFRALGKDIAMHITAANPLYLKPEDVPEDVLEKEKDIYKSQALAEGKPEKIIDRIILGKLKKYYEDACLLEQKFVKDPDISVGTLVNNMIAKSGENIVIKRFARFQLGDNEDK